MKPDTELHEAMKGLKEVLWRETRDEGVQWYYAEERLYVLRVRTGQPNEHYLLIKAHNPEEAIRRAIYNMKTAEECGGREMSFETKEDIVREMRMGAIGDMPFAYQVGIADTIEEFPSGAKMRKINIKKVTVKELADRFEEAFKHEKVNAGALLKALKEIRDHAVGGVYSGSIDCHEIIKIAEKALAAPPRNCDVGTAEEQAARFSINCLCHNTGRCSSHCEFANAKSKAECVLRWAQLHGNESEANSEQK